MTIAHGQLYNKDDPAKGIVRYNHALAGSGGTEAN